MNGVAWFCVALCAASSSGCASSGHHSDARIPPVPGTPHVERNPVVDRRLVRIGLELLNPANPRHDADKGRAYLEYALKHGVLKQIELPAPVLLEILRSEKVASRRSRELEEQLEIMKEIDLNREEAL